LTLIEFNDFIHRDMDGRAALVGPSGAKKPNDTAGQADMKRRVLTKAFLFSLMCGPALAADPVPTMKETPMLAEQVKSGALPPVAQRIPKQPWVVTYFAGGDGPGRQGGQINMLVASARDTRLMTIYSYTRLIIHDDKFKLKSDILESYEVPPREGVSAVAQRERL